MTMASELEALLHAQIPLSAAMGVQVLEAEPALVRLHAPLAPNHNHAGTVFAGSQHALASLAGWSLLRLWADTAGWQAELVLGRAEIRYLAPARGALTVAARLTDADLETLAAARREDGAARLDLTMDLETDAGICARFRGRYVARALATPPDPGVGDDASS